MKPIDPKQTVDYVCKCDRDEVGNAREDATHWKLRGLTKRQLKAIKDASAVGNMNVNGETGVTFRGGTVQFMRVLFGLASVERYAVAWAQAPDPLTPGAFVVADAFLDTIPETEFGELSARIDELCTLTESDAGKSSPPST